MHSLKKLRLQKETLQLLAADDASSVVGGMIKTTNDTQGGCKTFFCTGNASGCNPDYTFKVC